MTLPDPIEWTETEAATLGRFERAELLPGAGSERAYWRLWRPDGSTVLLMRYTPEREENEAFAPLTHWLLANRLRVPQIFAEHHEEAEGLIWLEDFGDSSLHAVAVQGGEAALNAYEKSAAEIARWHRLNSVRLPRLARIHLQPEFDTRLYRWEQDYFWHQAVARTGEFGSEEIEALRCHPALSELAEEIASWPRVPVHRDFQSTNVMVLPDGEIGVIDYQGLRLGVREYDLASLLFDPYVVCDEECHERVLDAYVAVAGIDREELVGRIRRAGVQRLMQALGAYGKLGFADGKTHFIQFIEPAAERLVDLVRGTELEEPLMPALRAVGAIIPNPNHV